MRNHLDYKRVYNNRMNVYDCMNDNVVCDRKCDRNVIPLMQSSMPSHLLGNGIHSKGKVLLFSWIHWNWFSSGHVVRQFSSSKPSSKAKLSYYLGL